MHLKKFYIPKWISKLITAVLVVVLILTTYVTLSSRISGGDPSFFGYRLMTVLSGSMEPVIHTGSLIAVKPVEDKNSLKEGDVITYESTLKKGMLITHRIIDVKPTFNGVDYIMKGDNNQAPDPRPIPSNFVVAKYADITIPYIGYIIDFIQSKKGLALLLIIPGILLVIWQVISLWRALGKWEKEKQIVNTSK